MKTNNKTKSLVMFNLLIFLSLTLCGNYILYIKKYSLPTLHLDALSLNIRAIKSI